MIIASEITEITVSNFLALEHSGQKGEQGTSILSDSEDIKFLSEMIELLKAKNQVIFTELRLNKEVISSACNLIYGNKAFAFKIGWDINYKKYSPGIINEIEFLQFADRKKLNFCQIESGAIEDSYLNRYWSGRWLLAEGVFVFKARAEILVTILKFLRRIIKSIVVLYESIIIPKK